MTLKRGDIWLHVAARTGMAAAFATRKGRRKNWQAEDRKKHSSQCKGSDFHNGFPYFHNILLRRG
jgi:hypothetical protein